MAHLVGDLVHYFKFDEVNIDNWHFKLYYKGGTILFFVGSMVGVLTQYFGDAINCDFTTINQDVASDYCWIHGSSYIPVEYQHHMKCIADLEGVVSEDDAPDTSYYQWVPFVLLMQAGMFYVPYKIWSALEGGLLETFGKDAKSAVIVTQENVIEGDDGPVMESTVNKFVKYFKSIFHHNQWYFGKFVLCEVLNVMILYLNFWMTDKFLQGRFWTYGIDVIKYYQLTRAERKMVVSPFCRVFPTEVSCTVPNIGAAGGEQNHNGMCVLSQNIINEKIYLLIWWYLVISIMISVVFVMYRLATILIDDIRFALLYSIVSSKYDDEIRKSLRVVLGKGYIGDWFVLYQLAKNVNMYFMREFIKDLRRELTHKPKRSKSTASKADKKEKHGKDPDNGLFSGMSTPTKRDPYAGNDGAIHSLLCCCVSSEGGCRKRRRGNIHTNTGKRQKGRRGRSSSAGTSRSRGPSRERRGEKAALLSEGAGRTPTIKRSQSTNSEADKATQPEASAPPPVPTGVEDVNL